MLILRAKQNGLTITELLIALTISMFVTLGILGAFSSSLFGSQQLLEKARLDRDLQVAMDMIVSDIQRAGYWSSASTTSTVTANPFMASTVDLVVNGTVTTPHPGITLTSNGNCIMLAYDKDGGSTLQDDEEFGYQLRNNAIEYRPAGASFPANCSPTPANWEQLTDPNFITVTAFTITKTNVATDIDSSGAGVDTVNNRTITITLTGQLANDSTTTKTITRTVNVSNNKYSP